LGGILAEDYVKSTNERKNTFLNYTNHAYFQTSYLVDDGDFCSLVVPTWLDNKEDDYYLGELRFKLSQYSNSLLYRTSHNGEASDWKTIAFTDSNVASAQEVRTADNKTLVQYNGVNALYIGDGIYDTSQVDILGRKVVLRYGASATTGLVLNSSGNVTIGSSDLAGDSYKLYVNGNSYVNGSLTVTNGIGLARNDANYIWATGGSNSYLLFGVNNVGSTSWGNASLRITTVGNVEISKSLTVSSAAKVNSLNVNDKASITNDGALSVSSGITSAGAITIKDTTYGIGATGVIRGSKLVSEGTIETSTLKVGGILIEDKDGDLFVNGNLAASGSVATKGIGSSSSGGSGTIPWSALENSLIAASASYNLGSSAKPWGSVYADSGTINKFTVGSTKIGDTTGYWSITHAGVASFSSVKVNGNNVATEQSVASSLSNYLLKSGGDIEGDLSLFGDYVRFRNCHVLGLSDSGSTQYWGISNVGAASFNSLTMSGPISFSAASENGTASSHYVSAGGGYSANSGKYGIKILCCDQFDAQTGLGQDLTGLNGGYELTVASGLHADGGYGYISFATHTVNSKTYRQLGYFKDYFGTISFHVNGNIYSNGKTVATQDYVQNNFAVKSEAMIDVSTTIVGNRVVKPTLTLTDGDSSWSMDVAKASGSNVAITKYCVYSESESLMELSQSGDMWLNGRLTQSSDETLKNIISHNVDMKVRDIANAPICYFTWKDRVSDRQIGTIAQYWQLITPECVIGEEGRMSMDYSTIGLVSSIINAREIVKHEDEIEALKKRVKELENEIAALKAA
jgi:hypothetical protein